MDSHCSVTSATTSNCRGCAGHSFYTGLDTYLTHDEYHADRTQRLARPSVVDTPVQGDLHGNQHYNADPKIVFDVAGR
jgi:hypothetical protein